MAIILRLRSTLFKQQEQREYSADVLSGRTTKRPELDRLLNVIQTDDTLIITRLDRIACSLIQGFQLLENLSDMDIIVEALNLGTIANSPTGKLVRNIMLSFSEFENDMII